MSQREQWAVVFCRPTEWTARNGERLPIAWEAKRAVLDFMPTNEQTFNIARACGADMQKLVKRIRL